jgi:hypothetical protein
VHFETARVQNDGASTSVDCLEAQAAQLIGSILQRVFGSRHRLGEAHLRRILKNYAAYYNGVRTRRSLQKDAPVSRPVQRSGAIISHAILGGASSSIRSDLVFGTHNGQKETEQPDHSASLGDSITSSTRISPTTPCPRMALRSKLHCSSRHHQGLARPADPLASLALPSRRWLSIHFNFPHQDRKN